MKNTSCNLGRSRIKRPIGITILSIFFVFLFFLIWIILFVYYVLFLAIIWIFYFPPFFLALTAIAIILSVFYLLVGVQLYFGEKYSRYLTIILMIIHLLIPFTDYITDVDIFGIFTHVLISIISLIIIVYLFQPNVIAYFEGPNQMRMKQNYYNLK